MPRYFLEVAYLGTHYSGFQVQKNANTIQREVERALKIYYQQDFSLTGSSRTDAGVHAEQNFFHFDTDIIIQNENLYNLNALLNFDIAVKKIFEVQPTSHCRFDATSRMYHYHIHRKKNPFLFETSYYYPFSLNADLLHQYAAAIKNFKDFTSFSKKKTQVNHFLCNIHHSQWIIEDDVWRYEIKADRFLRGMVKAITGTMLKLAKNEAAVSELEKIVFSKNCNLADFSPPSKGLFLKEIKFNPSIFILS